MLIQKYLIEQNTIKHYIHVFSVIAIIMSQSQFTVIPHLPSSCVVTHLVSLYREGELIAVPVFDRVMIVFPGGGW